ncbi:MAG: hypothetical protein HKN42_16310 [Granulosicoccus sp.]|nr:hypothetical protein [Granulosicoccus sp.]
MSPCTSISNDFEAAYAGPIMLLPLGGDPGNTLVTRRACHEALLTSMADGLYGPVPPPPDTLSVSRLQIAGERAERLLIDVVVADTCFTVDAALWLPTCSRGQAPLVCGLDFVGPVGLLNSPGFPIDSNARISSRPVFGARDNRMEETLRGTSAYRWPVKMLLDRGYAVLVSCYGSWVPDDASAWKRHGLYPLLGYRENSSIGAISLWAWAIQRLLDVAATCDEIDITRATVAGHSRLGKSALWAAANDSRIAAVFANSAGCGGSAPAAHPVGETLEQMVERFPHWTIPHQDGFKPGQHFDQHHLLSCIAPRALYLAGATGDLWSDPVGSFLALREAAGFWEAEQEAGWTWPSPREVWNSCGQVCNGALGYHLRRGGHDILPYDWQRFLAFLDQYYLTHPAGQGA